MRCCVGQTNLTLTPLRQYLANAILAHPVVAIVNALREIRLWLVLFAAIADLSILGHKSEYQRCLTPKLSSERVSIYARMI